MSSAISEIFYKFFLATYSLSLSLLVSSPPIHIFAIRHTYILVYFHKSDFLWFAIDSLFVFVLFCLSVFSSALFAIQPKEKPTLTNSNNIREHQRSTMEKIEETLSNLLIGIGREVAGVDWFLERRSAVVFSSLEIIFPLTSSVSKLRLFISCIIDGSRWSSRGSSFRSVSEFLSRSLKSSAGGRSDAIEPWGVLISLSVLGTFSIAFDWLCSSFFVAAICWFCPSLTIVVDWFWSLFDA